MKPLYFSFFILFFLVHPAFSGDGNVPLHLAKVDTPAVMKEYDDFYQAGRFYFGAQPDDSTFQWFADKGVTIVFNLRTDNEMGTLSFKEDSLLAEMGIKYVHIPMSGKSGYCPASVDTLAKYLEEQQGNALIHCAKGGRVTLLWMAYLVNHRGMSLDDSIDIGERMLFSFPLEKLLGKEVSMRVVE
jgi:protein tyrosine phosphatase (PTP) superfamily phosphohydrolase (DUF442 family)